MAFFKDVINDLKQNKTGLLAGGAVGAIFATILKQKGITTLMSAGDVGSGLIGKFTTNLPAVDVATIKFYFAAILVGAFIGYIIDKITK